MAKKKSKSKASPGDTLPIEDAMAELETIVASLESGQASLTESLERFERGMTLLRSCHVQLESAAQRIEVLSGISADGETVTQPFDGSATVNETAKGDADAESDPDTGPQDQLF